MHKHNCDWGGPPHCHDDHENKKPHVREEIQKLCNRGNITLAEYKELRGNSYEWSLVCKHLSTEALIYATEHALKNCRVVPEPPVVYEEMVVGVLAPELLKRVKKLDERLDEMANTAFERGLND